MEKIMKHLLCFGKQILDVNSHLSKKQIVVFISFLNLALLVIQKEIILLILAREAESQIIFTLQKRGTEFIYFSFSEKN